MIILIFSGFLVLLTIGLFLNKKPESSQKGRFSIIIACKNESKHLNGLFEAIEAINYSPYDYEVILIDDNSTDDTFMKMQHFAIKKAQYHALRLDYPDHGKKKALSKAIEFSMFPYIVLTDADCRPPANWLNEISEYLDPEHTSDMLIGYSPEINNSLFRRFLYLITATSYACTCGLGHPFSCTGRHLVFKKSIFKALGGYNGIEDIRSGDDKLLLNRFYKNKKKIRYMFTPSVATLPVSKEARKQQDLRRFGKFGMSRLYWQILSVLIAVFFILLPWFISHYGYYLEFLMLYISAFLYVFFSAKKHSERFYPVYLLYILYYPYFLIIKSIQGTFRNWTWK